MLKAFRDFRQRKQEADESIFGTGFSMPGRKDLEASSDYVAWAEVEAFLQMAEQALRVRTQANEALGRELESARSEKCKVEQTSSAAQEESSFLADHLQSLMNERAALKVALERAQRERDQLALQNELLQQELQERAALGEESGAAIQLLARQAEELRAERQRNAHLENENVQLQARVSALERANTAQATAMLSCLEESERVRLQQSTAAGVGGALQHLSLCDSPVGPLGEHHHASEYTEEDGLGLGGRLGDGLGEDSAFADAQLELGSESGSFVSCITPSCLTPSGSGGGGAGGAQGGARRRGGSGSDFHSLDCSPDHRQEQGQQGRQPHMPQPSAAAAAAAALLGSHLGARAGNSGGTGSGTACPGPQRHSLPTLVLPGAAGQGKP